MYEENRYFEMPDVIRLESSGSCNFKCLHCPNGLNNPKRGNLSRKLFQILMDQFDKENYTPRVVVLYHGGEPLLNPNLFEYISDLKQRKVKKISMVTNASLLSEKVSSQLIESGIDEIKFSFDGNSPEENNKIRVGGNFEKDSENVLTFIDFLNEKRRVDIYHKVKVIIANTKVCSPKDLEEEKNIGKIPEYLIEKFDRAKEQIEFMSFPAMVWPGYDSQEYFDHYSIKNNEKKCHYCTSAFETVSILSNGNIVPCCYDIVGTTIFGNMKETSLFEIAKGDKRKSFLKNILNGKGKGICSECEYFRQSYLIEK